MALIVFLCLPDLVVAEIWLLNDTVIVSCQSYCKTMRKIKIHDIQKSIPDSPDDYYRGLVKWNDQSVQETEHLHNNL